MERPTMEDLAAEEQGGGGPPLLSQVLRVVATSQFSTAAELGRLLLLTSKELTAAAPFQSENEMWEILCHSKWGIPHGVDILRTMLAEPTPFSSAEQCFRQIVAPPPRRQQVPRALRFSAPPPRRQVPRALRFSPEDYMMVITVCESDKKLPLFGKAIRGQQIPEFFETGKMNPVLSDHFHGFKKIKNGVAENGELAFFHSDFMTWNNDISMDVKVTLIRIPDQSSINLVNWGARFRIDRFSLRCFERGHIEWSCSLSAAPGWNLKEPKPRMNHDYGRALFEHCFPRETGFDRERKIQVEPDLTVRLVAIGDEGRDATFGISGFALKTRFTHPYLFDQDVTFAHFLEALDDWFIP